MAATIKSASASSLGEPAPSGAAGMDASEAPAHDAAQRVASPAERDDEDDDERQEMIEMLPGGTLPAQLLALLALLALLPAAWLAVAWWQPVREQRYLGIGLVTAYAVAELAALLCGSQRMRLAGGGRWAAVGRLLVVHALSAAGFVSLRRAEMSTADLGAQLGLAHGALLLVACLGWLAAWRVREDARLALAATAEAKELRVQYDALRTLVRGGIGYYSESDSDRELDDREHLIQPPPPVTLSAAAVGMPDVALPEALCGRTFDRPLARKIAAQIRRRHYGLAQYYEDIQRAFPELQLCACPVHGR